MMTFEGSIRDCQKKLGMKVKSEQLRISKTLHHFVLKNYPVYSGKTLGSWAWGIDAYPSDTPYKGGRRPPIGGSGEANRGGAERRSISTQAKLHSAAPYSTFILGNNAPSTINGQNGFMATVLEFGSPNEWKGRKDSTDSAIGQVRSAIKEALK